MTDSFDFVKATVLASSLSEADKTLVLERLAATDSVASELFEKILKEDVALLEKLVQNLKAKIGAQGDERALEDIARAEEKEIKKALKS